jgi:membrane protein DedA with SNARE-associated domain
MPSIAHLIHAYGLLVVAGVVGAEGVGIPLPGETALIIASVIAGSKHELNIVAVILVAAGASVVGRMIGYAIGRNFGYWLLLRYGGYVGITETRIKLGQYLFLRHGGKIIVIAQFIPVLRTLAGILAGANRMPRYTFMMTNILGASLWASFFGIAAYTLGRQVERLAGSVVFVCALGVIAALFLAAVFVKGHEAQLAAEAERALPGPLELP